MNLSKINDTDTENYSNLLDEHTPLTPGHQVFTLEAPEKLMPEFIENDKKFVIKKL
jgi:hypothetical protein